MYFPLLVFDGEGRLAGLRLRPGNAGNSRYAAPLMGRLVRKLKARFAHLRILVRADGGYEGLDVDLAQSMANSVFTCGSVGCILGAS